MTVDGTGSAMKRHHPRCPHCGGDISGVLPSLGGQARAASLTQEQRSEIARKGGFARQQKRREKERKDKAK